jgi:hypothetical protein
MISNDALWTQLQSALADLAASQAECARLRNVLLDIRDGGQMRTGYTYAALARAALDAQPQEMRGKTIDTNEHNERGLAECLSYDG